MRALPLKFNFINIINSFSIYLLVAYIPLFILLNANNFIILLFIKLCIFSFFFLNFIYLIRSKIKIYIFWFIVLIIYLLNNIYLHSTNGIYIFICGVWSYLSLLAFSNNFQLDKKFYIWLVIILMTISIIILKDFYINKNTRALGNIINPNTLSLFVCGIYYFITMSKDNYDKFKIIFILCAIIILFTNSRSGSIVFVCTVFILFINKKNIINFSILVLTILILNNSIDNRGGYEKFYINQIDSDKGNSRLEQSKRGFINFFNEKSLIIKSKKIIFGDSFGIATNTYLNFNYKYNDKVGDLLNVNGSRDITKIKNMSTDYLTVNSLIYNGGLLLFIFFIKIILFYPHINIIKIKKKKDFIIFVNYLFIIGIISLTMPFNEAFPVNILVISSTFNYFKKVNNQ